MRDLRETGMGVAAAVLCGLLAGSSLLQPGFYDSHDGLLNVHRLFELEKCLADGQIPCRWVPDMGAGYGYPLFNFYPPLASHIAVAFRGLGAGILDAVKWTMLLALVLGSVSMFGLARSFFGTSGGILAAVLYTFAPYQAVDVFVRGGGRLITLGSSSGWAVDLFGLPLTDVTRGESAEDFSCPGSVLRAVPVKSPWTAGLPSSMATFFSSSSAWKLDEQPESEPELDVDVQVLLRYAPSRLLLSGWIREPQTIEGQAAWVTASVGAGDVHLFGFRPHYRSWAQGTFQLLFRALLLEPGE